MSTVKVPNSNTIISQNEIVSSNVSNSLSGNMDLIKSQVNNKLNDYINIKNATKILEVYSNYNGYIKLYTEIQSNFNINDIVYITYYGLEENKENDTFSLQNPITPDDLNKNFYLGYKVLYVNEYKNEVVINKYYNDIPKNYRLRNQYLSKVVCRNTMVYNDELDGVVMFDNSHILNGTFYKLGGRIYSIETNAETGIETESIISGATIYCNGIRTISDSGGTYLFDIPKGNNTIKVSSNGYITQDTEIITNDNNYNFDVMLSPGENKLIISIDTDIYTNNVIYYNSKYYKCANDTIKLYSSYTGYTNICDFNWYISRSGKTIKIATNNNKISYTSFENDDNVYCEVTDNITTTISNYLIIRNIDSNQILIESNKTSVSCGEEIIFKAKQCENNNYHWFGWNQLDASGNTIYINFNSTGETFKYNPIYNLNIVCFNTINFINNNIFSNNLLINVSGCSFNEIELATNDGDEYGKNLICANNEFNTYYTYKNFDTDTGVIIYKDQNLSIFADTGFYKNVIGNYRLWNKDTLEISKKFECYGNIETTTTTNDGITTTTTTFLYDFETIYVHIPNQ